MTRVKAEAKRRQSDGREHTTNKTNMHDQVHDQPDHAIIECGNVALDAFLEFLNHVGLGGVGVGDKHGSTTHDDLVRTGVGV